MGGGRARLAEGLGDFGVRQAELDAGDDRFALLGAQPLHGGLVAVEGLPAHRFLQRRRRVGLEIGVDRVDRAAPLGAAGDVADRVPERGPDVIAERAGVAGLETLQPAEDANQGVLDQVLGIESAAGGVSPK